MVLLLLGMSSAAGAVAWGTELPCEERVRVSSGEEYSRLIHKVLPKWSEIVYATRQNGQVVGHVRVGCDGRVESVEVIAGPEALRAEFVRAVRQWTYRPYVVDGQARPVEFTLGLDESFGAEPEEVVLPSGRVRVASGVMAGRLVHKVMPELPPAPVGPHGERESGTTVLHAVIGRDGRVLELTPLTGPAYRMPAILKAVRQWRYRPYLVDGRPVEVETAIGLSINMGR